MPCSAQSELRLRTIWTNRLNQADAAFEKWMAENHIPGMVWGVVQHGRVVHVKAMGVQDLGDARRPVTTDTGFRIASMSKAFTGYAILKLRDEGKLRLDDPAWKYIPEIKSWAKDVGTSYAPSMTSASTTPGACLAPTSTPAREPTRALRASQLGSRDTAPSTARSGSATPARCGDGVVDREMSEDCDGNATVTAVCTDLNYDLGRPTCSTTCRLDTATCRNIWLGPRAQRARARARDRRHDVCVRSRRPRAARSTRRRLRPQPRRRAINVELLPVLRSVPAWRRG